MDKVFCSVWVYGIKSYIRLFIWYVEDVLFIRICSIFLGYIFCNLFGINMICLYVLVINLFIFIDYLGYNFEVLNKGGSVIIVGEDFGNYFVFKLFIFGFNVLF